MYIKVKVEVSCKNEKVIKKASDYYLISVREPAERNMANRRICQIIASLYHTNDNSVRIISGHHHKSKILSLNL